MKTPMFIIFRLSHYLLILFFCMFIMAASAHPSDVNVSKIPFILTMNSFSPQEKYSMTYTCDGKDISPTLSWNGVPDETETFALFFYDLNAPGGIFYHWVLYNIPKHVVTLPEGIEKLPPGVLVGKNSFGNFQYNGPCPPKGALHTYVFSLYALDATLNFSDEEEGATILTAAQKHSLGKAELMVKYGR